MVSRTKTLFTLVTTLIWFAPLDTSHPFGNSDSLLRKEKAEKNDEDFDRSERGGRGLGILGYMIVSLPRDHHYLREPCRLHGLELYDGEYAQGLGCWCRQGLDYLGQS
jgi:hypothetical protein